MATWYDVARIIRELALTSEPSPHDWRVGKKLLAWERPLRPSEREALTREGLEPRGGDILGVRVSDEGVKFGLIADEPGVYFTTPHFDGYPVVLVQLAKISVRDLEDLVTEAWLTQAPRKLVQEFLADSR
ncbi:MmcQ/YjbR family DNA-binding protein [Mycobacterium seoulense]|uniref:MmcQ/YjbR family DNA-binding protein n=1 Tax=Mycobacterium seoulense TaxID=386911 RepID=UPI003CEE6EFE